MEEPGEEAVSKHFSPSGSAADEERRHSTQVHLAAATAVGLLTRAEPQVLRVINQAVGRQWLQTQQS